MDLNKEQIGILEHTSSRSAGGLFCGDSADMQILCKMGLMEFAGKKSFVPDSYFRITKAGKKALSEFYKQKV